MNKTASSAIQLAKCTMLHAYSHTTASFQLREQTKTSLSLFNKMA